MSKDPLPRRADKTHPKTIYLTPLGRSQIEAWAQANQLNFSAAMETLALLGLNDERHLHLIPALRAVTLQGIQLAFNRLARLLSTIAIDSAVSRSMSEGIMLQLIRELSEVRPDDFEAVMRIPRDSRRQSDTRIRQFHDGIKEGLTQNALQRLRQPLKAFENLLQQEKEQTE